jgi:hypothetical protein
MFNCDLSFRGDLSSLLLSLHFCSYIWRKSSGKEEAMLTRLRVTRTRMRYEYSLHGDQALEFHMILWDAHV